MNTSGASSLSSQFADLLPQIAGERGFLIDIVVIILILAVLVMIVVELFKFILKPIFQRAVLRRWERALILRVRQESRALPAPASGQSKAKNSEPFKVPDGDIVRLHGAVYWLPRRLFMQQVENEVQRLLAEPGRQPNRVRILATGAAPNDIAEFVRWPSPNHNANRSGTQEQIMGEIRDHITITAERNVDILQLTLATRWLSNVRMASVIIGILGSQTLHFLEHGPFEPARAALLGVIGLVAGVAASLIHDLLGRLTGGDRGRY